MRESSIILESSTMLTVEDHAALSKAVDLLERSSLTLRLTTLAGKQLEMVGRALPQRATQIINGAAELAIKTALRAALATTSHKIGTPAANGWHRTLTAASGAAGGAFGLAALSVELPVSTTLMLRSIAQIARAQGENLDNPETALHLLEVFALGGRKPGEEMLEGGYFALRMVLAKSVSDAARFIAAKSAGDQTAPVIVRLISLIAAQFGIVVGEKLAAQALPLIGALGGAAVNYAFTQHFQDIALGHFTVRRLERIYGPEAVREAYEQIRLSGKSVGR
ncbi:EcsC family protein [Methylovirgula sp. 4M-Z18]|uniref:EcsC family protein n=1 Tax=Methylovirgula sp. 4M-Z18 TaxID=2293567 RepID=UPI001FDEB9CE|nr:EcsC family protein [Methylovirgula sp. 4M-Z18]